MLPDANGRSTEFPGLADGNGTSCEMWIGDSLVSVSVELPGFWEDRKTLRQGYEHYAELGPVWGVYTPNVGTLLTNLSCPTDDDPGAKLKVVVGSSLAEAGGSGAAAAPKAVANLARFSADATRSLATHFRCPAAADIPAGPMRVRGIRQ